MNLFIIGGTRGIGFETVKQARGRNHQVFLLARSPERFAFKQPDLKIIQGDIRERQSVEQGVGVSDVVIVCIGHPPTRRPVSVFSEGMKNVLQAMEQYGKRRLITVTGIGAGETRGHGGFFYDRIMHPLLLRTIYEDKNRQEALIEQSDTEWMIVRPGFLTNGPLTRSYKIVTDITGVKAGKISRADVAHFILEQVDRPAFIREKPLVTY